MATGLIRRSRIGFSLVAILVALLAGCSAATPTGNAALEGEWSLTSLGGAAIDPAVQVTLRFDGGNVTGNAGCNGIRGDYSRDRDSLKFGPLARTKRLCPGPRMDVEERVLTALAKVDSLEVTASTLVLTGGGEPLELNRGQ